jgi:hypothetical protein
MDPAPADPATPHEPAEEAGTGRPRGPPAKKLSEILMQLAADTGRERVAIGELKEALQGRAFGALMLIFAFPNILPSPPGLAGILGLPLVFLSAQMMAGRPPWLPQFIANRSMPRSSFAAVFDRAAPWVARAERMLRHRLAFLTWGPSQQALGAVCLMLSLLLMLPVPFGNMAPSIAICLIALGVLERDGVWVIAGLVASIGATIWVVGLGYALIKSAIFVLLNAF